MSQQLSEVCKKKKNYSSVRYFSNKPKPVLKMLKADYFIDRPRVLGL